MLRLSIILLFISSVVYCQTGTISDGESGSSVRTKLNATITKANKHADSIIVYRTELNAHLDSIIALRAAITLNAADSSWYGLDTDSIHETTTGHGVYVEGMLIEDDSLYVDGAVIFGDGDTRIWENVDDILIFKAGGQNKLNISTTGFTVYDNIRPVAENGISLGEGVYFFDNIKGDTFYIRDVSSYILQDTVGVNELLFHDAVSGDQKLSDLSNRVAVADSANGLSFAESYVTGGDHNTAIAGRQPLEATLTDIADGTITENLVNTANPWADNEVSNDLTITKLELVLADTTLWNTLDDSIAAHVVILNTHEGRLDAVDDSLALHIDTLNAHNGRIAALEAGGTSVALADSTTDAAGHYATYHDFIVYQGVVTDSLDKHQDTINAHNGRIAALEAGGGSDLGDTITTLWDQVMEDTIELDSVAHMLVDTISFSFGAGMGNTADSIGFQSGAYLGAFYVFQDSIVPRILKGKLMGEAGDSLRITIYYNSTFDGVGQGTLFSTTGIGYTSGPISSTTFAVSAIGPGNWVWMECTAIAGKQPKFAVFPFGYSEKRAN